MSALNVALWLLFSPVLHSDEFHPCSLRVAQNPGIQMLRGLQFRDCKQIIIYTHTHTYHPTLQAVKKVFLHKLNREWLFIVQVFVQ